MDSYFSFACALTSYLAQILVHNIPAINYETIAIYIYLISVCSISCAGQTGDGRTSLNEKFGY